MAVSKPVRALIISDFNTQNIAGYLSNSSDHPRVEASVSPFGQVIQTLMDSSLPCWTDPPDVLVVWTQPQRVLESFSAILEQSGSVTETTTENVLEDVDTYCRLLSHASERVQAVFIPTWVVSAYHRGLGMIDLKSELGVANQLMRANLRLIDNLKGTANIYVLNSQRWMVLAGARNAHNPKLWYMGKLGFGDRVIEEAAKDIKAALRGISGLARKLILLDLDDTLWGGILGDVGWDGLRLGGHDPMGESFADFQGALKALKNRGVLLGIVSKNEENIALEAISRHPEMVLSLQDFVGWRINWNDKACNIEELVLELNLGLQSVVFIDDNPSERSRISEALPEVLVPDWPVDQLLYKKTLLDLDCFDSPVITEEDLARTKTYAVERKRRDLRSNAQSFHEWIHSLKTQVIVEDLNAANLPRAVQLMNKTNQMNLSSRRMSEEELCDWSSSDNRHLWTFRVADKFGDAGVTGLASIQIEQESATIIDFVLSCRVIGRMVEETMLHFVTRVTEELGVNNIIAEYVPTPNNNVCLSFWIERSGFEVNVDGKSFTLLLDEPGSVPDGIELVMRDAL